MILLRQNPPVPPASPQPPPLNLPGAIRQYLKARGIWQTTGARFLLNDEHSRQVRRDTIRFRIDKRDRLGK